MNLSEFELKLNQWGQDRVPFFFLIDFEMEKPVAWKLDEVPPDVLFSFEGRPNHHTKTTTSVVLKKNPIALQDYKAKFDVVKERIAFGDSYLTNLTLKTRVELNQRLDELFFKTNAKYKICWKERFLCFSPETFVKIID